MKVLATSDMHGMLDGLCLDGIDLALFAGDIAPLHRRGPWHVYDQIKWMRKDFANFCSKWPHTEIVFVPGNHDFFPIAKERFGSILEGHHLDIDLPSNAHMLVDREISIAIGNESIKVYGTPWVPIISHSWAFELEDDKLAEKFKEIPKGIDILLTHTPPRLNAIDMSLQWGVNGKKFGSGTLASEIALKQPRYVFCGHIHSGDHKMQELGNSRVYNVSRVDERYEIAYEPLVLEI